jgi:hypothetical protein
MNYVAEVCLELLLLTLIGGAVQYYTNKGVRDD